MRRSWASVPCQRELGHIGPEDGHGAPVQLLNHQITGRVEATRQDENVSGACHQSSLGPGSSGASIWPVGAVGP